MTARPSPAGVRLRCAIYTRKSSEEGLDQSFNSLDAQREACEAYVMSQVGEGWTALPARYDDGGFSGGSMERPGLKQLLADIERGKVDIVVVYKVDRLTRSLADFAKIVEIFDNQGASFVSVTQAFNTTTSMGRLTLNVLLSFAQFEREVTGERIRDKIAASKKKGMWMGGVPPLGYRPDGRTLAIEEAEAEHVRHIFARYLHLKAVSDLADELNAEGIENRRKRGPMPFTRGALYHLLANRIYVGEIVHKDESYPGQHTAIVDRETFDAAQALLAANQGKRQDRAVTAARAPLTGLLFDAAGKPLTPVAARRGERVYRYYVSAALQVGRARKTNGVRLPASTVEQLVLDQVSSLITGVAEWAAVRSRLVRVEVHADLVAIELKGGDRLSLAGVDEALDIERLDNGNIRLIAPIEIRKWAGRYEIERPRGVMAPARVRMDRTLIRGLGKAHSLLREARQSPTDSVGDIAARRGTTESYVRRLMRLAFLAPDIQRAILEGRQSREVTLERLMRGVLPLSWSQQRAALGHSRH